jgi:hypothetical protein
MLHGQTNIKHVDSIPFNTNLNINPQLIMRKNTVQAVDTNEDVLTVRKNIQVRQEEVLKKGLKNFSFF